MFSRASAAFVLLSIASSGEDLPPWLRDAVSRQAPATKSAAVVLHDEATISIEEAGKLLTRVSRAVRILKREGASEAIARAIYTTDTGKVKEFRAWLVRPSGEVRKYGKNDVADVALVNNDIYNEVRVKAISGRAEADPGAVLAFEFELEDKTMFTQFERTLQEDIPVAFARFTVAVPAGWILDTKTYNNTSLKASVMSGRHTWELRDVAAVESEPFGPTTRSQAARVAVTALPPQGATGPRSFSNWADVAGWLHEIAEPQLAADNNLVEKAQSLTRNAKTEWEKIQAIGRFTQTVQYVSIQTGIGRGGGYKSRTATLVLSRNYGDCKDKANLMRAMLRVVGVEGYPVAIYSGDRTYVHDDWPSPQQFNHCIFAAKLKEEATAPAVVNHPKIGRLVLFDPTDEHTPFGLLPWHEENSFALVAAPGMDGLVRTPSSQPKHNLIERAMTGALGHDGELTASIRETSHGHAAVASTRSQADMSAFRKELEGWLSAYIVGARVENLKPERNVETSGFEATIRVEAFGQVTGNLFMFRPAPVWLGPGVSFADKVRRQPLMLQPRAGNDSFTLALPTGYSVDEMPPPINLKSGWGTFDSTCELKGEQILVRRSLTIHGGTVQPEQYSVAREFFGHVAGSARMPVVLVKK